MAKDRGNNIFIKARTAYSKAFKESGYIRHSLLAALKSAGNEGLTSAQLKRVTKQDSRKLARQSVRKARWAIFEDGYRLVYKNERNDKGYKLYRVIKINGDRIATVQRKLDVTAYSVKAS